MTDDATKCGCSHDKDDHSRGPCMAKFCMCIDFEPIEEGGEDAPTEHSRTAGITRDGVPDISNAALALDLVREVIEEMGDAIPSEYIDCPPGLYADAQVEEVVEWIAKLREALGEQ